MWGEVKKLLRSLRHPCNIIYALKRREAHRIGGGVQSHASDGDKALIAVNIVYVSFTIRGGFNTSVRRISSEGPFRVISN